MNALSQVLAMGIGGFGVWLFAAAATQKLSDFPRFQATLGAYRLLPQGFTPMLAKLVIGAELVAGVALLAVVLSPGMETGWFGFPLLGIAWVGPLLLLAYALAMALNLRRGRSSIDCGCGGTPMPLSRALVGRNLGLAFGLWWAVLARTASPTLAISHSWTLLLLVLCSALLFGMLYLSANQLLANRALRDKLWMQNS